jgi:pre-mRNA-splicing factor SYF1
MYLDLMTHMCLGTIARQTFDRALQSLPITQHEPIWEQYLDWTKKFNLPETTIQIYRRYLQYDPSHREELVNYLEQISQYEEAAQQLSICINDESFVPLSGSTKHQLWMRLCDLCASHPVETSRALKVDAVIRSGINRFSDEVGRLWTRLADYYIRLGQFEKARDIYEEAMQSVVTVRDFTLIFDSYLKCEESILMATMREAEEIDKDLEQGKVTQQGDEDEREQDHKQNEKLLESLNDEIELRLARLEYLTERRPVLLNSVMLRQNPNNIYEWHKRVKLYKGNLPRILMTYMEAIKTITPIQAHGKLSTLWLGLAKVYEDNKDLTNCREVYKKASQVEFRSIDELSYLWCQWAEMELRHQDYAQALQVLKQAVTEPKSSLQRKKAFALEQGKSKITSRGDDPSANSLSLTVADKLHRNVKVWSFYLDLEESLGTLETCRAAYDRMIEMKIITPQILLNYCSYLEERGYHEDSYRIYERGVALFTYPHVKPIWLTYLDKFMARYGGNKLERLRDLFEQSVAGLPSEEVSEFYLKYGRAEEEYGLIRHAMAIYDRATKLVPEKDRGDMYRLYVKKIEHYYGVTKARAVYERAIQELNDDQAREICIEYAETETKLGEIDRARAIYQHGAQFADPRVQDTYWSKWRKFEEAYGNMDTFKDMLRVQRSIETANSQVPPSLCLSLSLDFLSLLSLSVYCRSTILPVRWPMLPQLLQEGKWWAWVKVWKGLPNKQN